MFREHNPKDTSKNCCECILLRDIGGQSLKTHLGIFIGIKTAGVQVDSRRFGFWQRDNFFRALGDKRVNKNRRDQKRTKKLHRSKSAQEQIQKFR
jgi:hypothetical protein